MKSGCSSALPSPTRLFPKRNGTSHSSNADSEDPQYRHGAPKNSTMKPFAGGCLNSAQPNFLKLCHVANTSPDCKAHSASLVASRPAVTMRRGYLLGCAV